MQRTNRAPRRIAGLIAALAIACFSAATGAQTTEDSALQPRIEIPRVDAAIALDGDLDEAAWEASAKVPLAVRTYRERPDPTDLQGTARIFWNESGLYVAVEVVDDAVRIADAPRRLWNFDSVEVWIHHLWIQTSPNEDGEPLLWVTRLDGSTKRRPEPQAGATTRPDGYSVELFIPKELWEAAVDDSGGEITAGAEFLLAVGLRDLDEGEREPDSPLYFPPRFGWNNLESMAIAVLQ